MYCKVQMADPCERKTCHVILSLASLAEISFSVNNKPMGMNMSACANWYKRVFVVVVVFCSEMISYLFLIYTIVEKFKILKISL